MATVLKEPLSRDLSSDELRSLYAWLNDMLAMIGRGEGHPEFLRHIAQLNPLAVRVRLYESLVAVNTLLKRMANDSESQSPIPNP